MSLGFGFMLKKGISFLLMPLSIGMMLGLLGMWFVFRNKLKKAKLFIIASFMWIALISYAPVANALLAPLEQQYSKLETIPHNVEHILLLGGDKEKRTWEAIRLYHQIPNAKIITSGYSMHDKLSEAVKTAKLLEEAGVKKEHILMQSQAKDTQEEALAIKERLGEAPFLLVTSAYHMPRAMKLFQSQGVNPIAAAGDFNNPNEDSLGSIFQSKQIQKTEKALHEYLGLLWIMLRG